MTHQQSKSAGTKYGIKEIPVGESRIIENAERNKIVQAVRQWNGNKPREDWIGIYAQQIGANVVVKRIY